MKVATTSLAKFKRLQRRLKLRMWQAVGILESLWWIAARNTPHGDIGRLSNDDIAALMEWEGDADELIAALSDGWLDPHSTARLVVHDWRDHAPKWVLMNLRRKGDDFTSAEQSTGEPADRPAEPSTERPAEPTSYDRASEPSPPFPSRLPDGGSAREASPPESEPAFPALATAAWEEHYHHAPTWSDRDRAALAEVAVLLGDEQASVRWLAYLADADGFFRGHPPKRFREQLDRWAGAVDDGRVRPGETKAQYLKRIGAR